MRSFPFRKYIFRTLRAIAWTIAAFFTVILLLVLALLIPAVQTYITGKVTSSLSESTGTEIKLERVAVKFPRSAGIEGLFIEDLSGDTLLYARSLFIDIRMMSILRNKLHFRSIEINGLKASVSRERPDSVFNYQFLIDNFNGSGKKKDEQSAIEPGMEIMINKITLKSIQLYFKDHHIGMEVKTNIEGLQTSLSDSDLTGGRYHAGETVLTGAEVDLFSFEPSLPPSPAVNDQTVPDIWFRSFQADNLAVRIRSEPGTDMEVRAGSAMIIPGKIDMEARVVDILSLNGRQLYASVTNPPSGSGPAGKEQTDGPVPAETGFSFVFEEIMDWTVGIGDLKIEDSEFGIRRKGEGAVYEKFDPNNFTITGFSITGNDILVGPRRINLDISHLNMLISEKFHIGQMTLYADMDDISGRLSAAIESPETSIDINFSSNQGILNLTPENLQETNFSLVINPSYFNGDLAFFFPGMDQYYFNWPDTGPIEFNGALNGSLSDITADSLEVSAPGFISLKTAGNIKGIAKAGNTLIRTESTLIKSFPSRLFDYLPDSLQIRGIKPPEFLDAALTFEGNLNDFEAVADLTSEFGDIGIRASLSSSDGSINHYSGKLHTRSFDIGRLMELNMLTEPASLNLEIAGRGTEPANMDMDALLTVGGLYLNEHLYDDIDIRIGMRDSVVSISGIYRDELLSVSADIEAGIFSDIPFFKGSADVEYADMNRLGFMENDLLASTRLEADIKMFPPGFFNGDIKISDTNIASGGEMYTMPEIVITSSSDTSLYSIRMDSGFGSASWQSSYNPAETPQILTKHLSGYFSPGKTMEENGTGNDHFELELTLLPDEFFSNVLMPVIGQYDTLSVFVLFDNRQNIFSMTAAIDDLQYGTLVMKNLKAELVSDPYNIDFGLSVDSLNFSGNEFSDFNLTWRIADQVLEVTLSMEDNEPGELFFIRSYTESIDELYHISVDPRRLIMNREEWRVDPQNRLIAGKDTLSINNLVLENKQSRFSVNSRYTDEYRNILDIHFSQFEIGSIIGFMQNMIPFKGGTINGYLTGRDIQGEPTFLANLELSNLVIYEDTINQVILKAENPETDLYFILLEANHKGTSIQTSGKYITGEEPGMDIDIILEKLNLSLAENFTGGAVSGMEGYVTGKVKVSGKPENPLLTGEININETTFRVPALNTRYLLKNESIRFDRQNIRFNNFTLEDSLGRTARLNGNVNFANLESLILKLNLSTRNFMLMNLPQTGHDMYHGQILTDIDLTVSGSHVNPLLEGRIKLNEGSSLTFLLPQPAPEAVGDEGVVEFITDADSLFLAMMDERTKPVDFGPHFERVTTNLNIELDRQTGLKIIIDDQAGDFLELKGGAVLSFAIDPGGKMSLTGRYEIVEGAYMLTFYDVIRRNFRIRPGSSLVWTGDPLDASLDITAIYTLRTSARELMRGHAAADQAQSSRIRQQYPFLVYLNMKENLMAPEISFHLDMPPEHRNALDGSLMARLNQINQNDSELNKQVFALLILGSFIQENPLDFSGRPGFSSAARSSGSQILTQQLNRLSDRYIRGLDVNFELESYEEFEEGVAAGRTELQMEVSRNFFDERIRITVGGNIELEDETRRETGAADIAGDFSIEYLLTPEGTILLKGFRSRDYGDLIEGDVTKTGISMIFSRSFNRFRDFFRKREDEPDNMEQEPDSDIELLHSPEY